MIHTAWKQTVTAKVIRDAWDKSGLETKEGGSNPERLFPAVKRAAPFKDEAVKESDADREFFHKAMEAPLPCPEQYDFRREVPEVDMKGMHDWERELVLLRNTILLPHVYRPIEDLKKYLFKKEQLEAKKKKKLPHDVEDSRLHLHARFFDQKVSYFFCFLFG